MNYFKNWAGLIALIAAVMALSACGGGGSRNNDSGNSNRDGGIPPAAPTLLLTPQAIKTFHFSWDDVANASEYRLLENPDGISGYIQVATIAAGTTHYDHEVFLPARINASYILQACNNEGCTNAAPVHVEGSLAAAVGYVKASNTRFNGAFGNSVALAADGNTLAVGAPGEASNATGIDGDQTNDSAPYSGAVYVFTRDAGVWSQQAYIKASNTRGVDQFGTSVSLAADGNTLAVGARGEASNATGIDGDQTNDSAFLYSGAVYVFTRDAGVWSQQAYVKASNTGRYDEFGTSVSLAADGNTLAVGAPYEDSNATGIDGDQTNNSAPYTGAVYVFTRDAGVWSQQAYVKASNTGNYAHFGTSVSLAADGNTLAVGAPYEDSNATGIDGDQTDSSAANSGAVYVFTRDAGVWSQQAYIKASNTGSSDEFGTSVSLAADGNTLAVGAHDEASNATGIDGDQTNNSAPYSGAVYVFTRDAGVWSQQAYIKASNTNTGDYVQFGTSVSLAADGNTLAVGARGEASNATGIDGDQTNDSAPYSGAVYVFTRDAGIWSQQAYVKASNTASRFSFGDSVTLTADGSTLAVGATGEASNATGIDGDQTNNSAPYSGAVYLY